MQQRAMVVEPQSIAKPSFAASYAMDLVPTLVSYVNAAKKLRCGSLRRILLGTIPHYFSSSVATGVLLVSPSNRHPTQGPG